MHFFQIFWMHLSITTNSFGTNFIIFILLLLFHKIGDGEMKS